MGFSAARYGIIPLSLTQGRNKKRRSRSVTVNIVPWLLLILSFTMGSLLHVQARTSVIRERYLLKRTQAEFARSHSENRELRLAWATLSSPQRVEKGARKQFGLRYPRPEEVIKLP